MCYQGIQRFIFVVFLLFAVGSPALAEGAVTAPPAPARSTAHTVLLADVGSIGSLITAGGRTRVVQFCVAIACLALFILMRRFNE